MEADLEHDSNGLCREERLTGLAMRVGNKEWAELFQEFKSARAGHPFASFSALS